MLHLLPVPRIVRGNPGSFQLSSLENLILPAVCPDPLLDALTVLADETEAVTGSRIRFARSAVAGISIRLENDPAISGREEYVLDVHEDGILLKASEWTGFFYGIQTLRQLIRTAKNMLPCLHAEDSPDFAARGFYHDCTRGKVPTLTTLFKLADKMAYYKLNQLQLYVEHTFAFARHSDMWSGADPLTAEEILRLDSYCAARNIELVPSISTFGHFYMGLRSKRKEHLNELDIKASEKPYSFHDRMRHYTLDPSDPGSLALVEDMLSEFLPLFRSRYCNICCDETFDLGKGKNADSGKTPGGTTALYVKFLKKIIAAVNKSGKSAMFWGDIIAECPELIRELPADTIPLEWDYSPDAKWRDTARMRDSGFSYYICPGVAGWNRFLCDLENASLNIIRYAEKGRKFGASGLLNTDWGDYGHINLLSCSCHGFVLGAACAWNGKASSDPAVFDRDFSLIELGDPTGGIVSAWRTVSANQKFSYADLQKLFDPGFSEEEKAEILRKLSGFDREEMRTALELCEKSESRAVMAFASASPLDPLAKSEILCAFRGERLVQLSLMAILGYDGIEPRSVADRLRAFETEFAALWHKRNKPSEYYRLRMLLMKVAERLDSI